VSLSGVWISGIKWGLALTVRRGVVSYAEPIRGTTALITAYLVAFTQLIPEHQVQLFGRLRLRVKVCPRFRVLRG
jgi:hypothetical protein